ncbi:MAG: pyridoxamine 5'-phosphate oxidase [Acidobacteriota bacterium]|nr:pyridoxamine 5'-phosphate oxidase [Acidobacteriota bacterium]
MMMSIADLRREYASRALGEAQADADPIRQFTVWFDEAASAQILDVNAMTLATTAADGDPDARIVLLKGFDDDGFVFFTNYESTKGRELLARPRACLLFFWVELERQVRITGAVTKVSRAESEEYFHSRPFESQVGAWASAQSTPVADRAVLETRYAELTAQYAGQSVPLPEFWGGYRVAPEQVEFWQGRPSRLHDRLLYTRGPSGWSRSRLAP